MLMGDTAARWHNTSNETDSNIFLLPNTILDIEDGVLPFGFIQNTRRATVTIAS